MPCVRLESLTYKERPRPRHRPNAPSRSPCGSPRSAARTLRGSLPRAHASSNRGHRSDRRLVKDPRGACEAPILICARFPDFHANRYLFNAFSYHFPRGLIANIPKPLLSRSTPTPRHQVQCVPGAMLAQRASMECHRRHTHPGIPPARPRRGDSVLSTREHGTGTGPPPGTPFCAVGGGKWVAPFSFRPSDPARAGHRPRWPARPGSRRCRRN